MTRGDRSCRRVGVGEVCAVPPGGGVQWWLPLHQHLDDARGVAERLVEEWLPRQVVERIAVDLPDGCDGVRRVAGWLAAVHDVGKASPVFAVQVPVLCDRMARAGLPTDPRVGVSRDRSSVRHELVGCLAVQDWLHRVHGFAWRGIAQQLAVVVGSHHGVPPEDSQLQVARESGPLAGVGPWTVVRDELLERATTRCGGEEALDGLRAATLSLPSQVLLTAIVIMADWIASSTDLFPLDPVYLLGDVVPLQEGPVADRSAYRLERAWAALDLPRPWRPGPLVGSLDRLLAQRFAITGATARPVQRAAVEAAVAQTRPGMVIVEAPMGEGKTEAALLVVEELASRSGAGGCFIALPTQATSDAMFVRALHWVRALPREAAEGPASVFLAHGKAVLNEEFRGLRPGARFASIGVDGDAETAVAHWWFGGRRHRRPLQGRDQHPRRVRHRRQRCRRHRRRDTSAGTRRHARRRLPRTMRPRHQDAARRRVPRRRCIRTRSVRRRRCRDALGCRCSRPPRARGNVLR